MSKTPITDKLRDPLQIAKDFVTEQSCGEWDDKTILQDASLMASQVIAPERDHARRMESDRAELIEALESLSGIDGEKDGYKPNERVRAEFLKSCPEFIGYAKRARALLDRMKGEA